MNKFTLTEEESNLNKILKMNQEISKSLLANAEYSSIRSGADKNIEDSLNLLRSLGKNDSLDKLVLEIDLKEKGRKIEQRPEIENWDEIAKQANDYFPMPITLEDIMTKSEIEESLLEFREINHEFSRKTSIINKTDLSFLMVATALQVAKSLVFPYVAEKFHYGETFDKSKRKKHNDKSIDQEIRKSKEDFRNKKLKKHDTGRWIEILFQTPPYDTTRGSKDLGINMGGAYHRMYTLGHDPILGWIFGTMNILTDVVTLNNFKSYRVTRDPIKITREVVPIHMLFTESYECIHDDFLNLPAAIFAQAQHMKSDKFTKLGLPVPILSSFNEKFASELYKSNYDALCLARDTKIIGASFVVSKIFDIIISLVHGLFRKEDEATDTYEVRTRKILLISNSIASSSTIINASLTSNPKNLDVGSLLNTVVHLFTDVRFIFKVKREFVQNEISNRLQREIDEIDRIYVEM